MIVSPLDYELYSRVTGQPIPMSAAERMKMAPVVNEFTKNYTKAQNRQSMGRNILKIGALGALGAAVTRFSEVTPIIRTFPACSKATASEKPVDSASISPESNAAIAFPPASKGMYLTFVGSAPAALNAIAATRWSIPPGTEPPPMATALGFFL